MASNKELLTRWMQESPSNAADAILELAVTLTAGQKTALKNRVVSDIQARQDARSADATAQSDAADDLSL